MKTIKALREFGLLAKQESDMNKQRKSLAIGEEKVVAGHVNFSTYRECDKFITALKVIDEKYIPSTIRMFDEADVDTVIFPCSAAVGSFLYSSAMFGMDGLDFLNDKTVIAMGEMTANAVESIGHTISIKPEKASITGLLELLKNEAVISADKHI